MTLPQVKIFIDLIRKDRKNHYKIEPTPALRHKVKQAIKCVKKEYQKLWRGNNLLNPRKESQLYRMEETLWNLF